MPLSSLLRARLRAVLRLLRQVLLVLFILALAAVPLPFATLLALARRPERELDAVVELVPRRRARKDKRAR